MTTADYNATLAGLNASMEDEVGVQLAANKAAVVGLFPGLWAWLIRGLLWPCLLKIGKVIGAALVNVVLKRLGQMTLSQVAGLLDMYLRTQGMPINPSLKLMSDHDLFAGADPEPPSRVFIRPTQVYAYHYSHNGETFCETLRAYDFDDAEARCEKLGVTLDGEIN